MVLLTISAGAGETRTQSFDQDPLWPASNNRLIPKEPRKVTQDFGYNRQAGDIGGRITRALKPAYYALALDKPKTLSEKFSASGVFYLTETIGGGAAFVGFFNSMQREGTGRPANSLGFEIGTERSGGRLSVRLLTAANHGAGKFITKFEHYHDPAKKAEMRPTSIRNDGTRYTWTLSYDPAAATGNGQIQFLVKSNLPQPDYFENKLVTVDLPAGYKQESDTSFNRFGMLNGTKPGGQMTLGLDDIQIDDRRFDFSTDPKWIESGCRSRYDERTAVGAQDFGYSAATQNAGGMRPGEIGGDMWRAGVYAYYADRVGPLSLDDRLEASGKVVLISGAPDSDIFLGYFAGDSQDQSPVARGNFVGIHVGGPTRVGHYFQPAFTSANGNRVIARDGPVMRHGKSYDWSFLYDPAAENGNGAITVRLGEETVTLPLKAGLKKQGGHLDHFGLLNSPAGGQLVRIYLDDITYTSSAPR